MWTYTNIRYALGAVIALGLLSIAYDLSAMLRTPTSITLVTEPIEVLESHNHVVARGDSLQSIGHVENVLSETLTLPHDTWVTGMEIISNNVPRAVIHHMHLFAPERTDPYCTVMPEMLMDIGQDAIPMGDFPKGYGLFLPKGTVVQVNAALHNPEPPLGTGEEYHDVSVGFTLRVDRFGSLRNLKPLSLHIISLADDEFCTATTFTVPPTTSGYTKRSAPNAQSGSAITVRKPGTIVALGAHIHAWEGGEDLRVYKNDELITTFLPDRTSTQPDVWQTLPYYKKIPVQPGDVLSLSATYSNPHDIPVTGAMGMAAFFIHYD